MRYNLSEVFDVIKDRRTIYPEQYSPRKVHKEIIEKLLNAATWAPTHGNTQPWRFKVFMEEDARKNLGEYFLKSYKNTVAEEKQTPIKIERMTLRPAKASAVIAICMHRQDSERIPEIEEIEAVACAVQNMQIMGTAYGLGCFWSSPKFIYTQDCNTFLGLRPQDKCLGFLYLGYPENEWPKGQRKPIEYLTEWK